MATDITQTFTYPHMDPALEINGLHGLSKSLPSLYGPNYDSLHFTPLFNNIRTAALMSKPHHCTHNDSKGHAMTRRCVADGHQAYCLEWVTESGQRVRCGTRFKVISGGCGAHPAKSMEKSMNLEVKNLVAGKIGVISWGALNDPQGSSSSSSSSSSRHVTGKDGGKNANLELLSQHDEELEAMEAVGKLPVGSHTAYSVHVAFIENKVKRERAEQEQRKLRAAERKSRAGGKMSRLGLKADETDAACTQDSRVAEAEKKRFGGSLFKSTKKCGRQDTSKWLGKRGGKNAAEASV